MGRIFRLDWKQIKTKLLLHWPALTIFFVLFWIGVFAASNYGLAWDEYVMRELGYMDYDYITKGGQYKPNPFYGPITELPLVILEVKLGITDYKNIFVMRHIYCFSLYMIGILCLYFTAYKVFDNRNVAVISALLLASYPVCFGHAFFNSKDIPFLSIFSVVLWALINVLYSRSWLWFGILGVVSGLLINARIIGLVIIPSVGLTLILGMAMDRNSFPLAKTVCKGFVFLGFTALSLFVSWPLLWEDPLHRFLDILGKSSNYTFFGANILFNGEYLNSLSLPRSYLLGWMAVTIPIVIIILCLIGIFISIFEVFKLRLKEHGEAQKGLFALNILICFFLPFVAVSLFRTPLFDGWRHMFFLYLFIVWFAAYTMNYFVRSAQIGKRVIGYALPLLQIVLGFVFIVRNHPYEHLYFNEVVSKESENIRKNFEFDYWGLSYRRALEYILSSSEKGKIRIAVANSPGKFNQFILSKAERERIVYVKTIQEADFFVSNYRGHPQEYPLANKVYEHKVMNSTVVSVWHIQKQDMDKDISVEQ